AEPGGPLHGALRAQACERILDERERGLTGLRGGAGLAPAAAEVAAPRLEARVRPVGLDLVALLAVDVLGHLRDPLDVRVHPVEPVVEPRQLGVSRTRVAYRPGWSRRSTLARSVTPSLIRIGTFASWATP